MIAQTRVGSTARVFAVAAILGLSLALRNPTALQGTLLLAAVAAVAAAAELSAPVSARVLLLAEAGVAALVVGLTLPEGVLLLPYLVIPALLAGLTVGVRDVALIVVLQVVSLLAIAAVSGELDQLETLSEILGPWLVTTLGIGLVGSRLRSLRTLSSAPSDSSYEAARRLLNQLRLVARRLSSGLDSAALADELLGRVGEQLAPTVAAVYVRTDGGVLAPLAFAGPRSREAIDPQGRAVDRCWAEMVPMQEIQVGAASRRYRTVLPLRVGSHLIGLVVADGPDEIDDSRLSLLMRTVDDHALRLDAALTFDEIRSLATMEERQRLAREIHDGIAQEIASLGYVVDELAAQTTSEAQLRKLRDLRSELSRVVSELRLSIFDLRTEVSAGLGSALSEYVREIGSKSGMTVHLTLDVSPQRLRREVELELFRIAQEAIANARKHSSARNLWVDCRIDPPTARISVTDDGQGLSEGRDDSYGLDIMRERAERIGARLVIEAAKADYGTAVVVSLGSDRQGADLTVTQR